MRIGRLEKQLNKWQVGIDIGRRWEISFYWPMIRVWWMKLVSFPPQGAMLVKSNYRGLYLYWSPPIPIITVRTFRIVKKHFSIPIKIYF
jgi:hypothetical protein